MRQWTDLDAPLPEDDGAFQQRFTVRARQPGQTSAMLDEALRVVLARFDEAALDDDHAVLTCADGVLQLAGLQGVLIDIQVVTANLAAAALADRAAAWAFFAGARGATFRVGDLTLHGWSVKGLALRTATRCEKGAARGVMELMLPAEADATPWEDALPDGLDTRTGVREDVARVECELPEDPASLMPLAERVAEVALSLQRAGGDAGAYRHCVLRQGPTARPGAIGGLISRPAMDLASPSTEAPP
ncbi:MAG: hypothetical protein R3A48_09950 [Polyangiales bacterium]